MNLPEYHITELLSHGRPWLEHVASPEDKKLFGTRGYIWKCVSSDHDYGAWITSHHLINSKYPADGVVYKKGDEHRVFFPEAELKAMILALGIPTSGASQLSLLEAYERPDSSKSLKNSPMISSS